MRQLRNIFILSFSIISSITFAQVQIIPYPNEVITKIGEIDVSRGLYPKGKSDHLSYIKKMLETEFAIPTDRGVPIQLRIAANTDGSPEAYTLDIKKNQIDIQASTETGIFYAIQSLKQLLLHSKQLPLLTIKDAPAFKWRSFMLDDARYFQGKETVKKLLDDMALLKMNRFHWHLTNDAGWRIEIKSFPLLTEIGSTRDSSQINDSGKKWKSTRTDHKVHQGFYTQEDIKEIIAYASERHIMIIPEVSMPGHMSAAIASYPFLGTKKKKISIPSYFGVVTEVLDVSSLQAKEFVHTVLKEVAELFPSNFIHIGGDEVKYDQWKASPAIQEYMKSNNIDTYYDLQVYFTNEVSRFVDNSLHKRVIGWNEILGRNVHEWAQESNANTTLSKNAIIQFWKGNAEDLLFGIDKGHEIINSDHRYTYLDYTYKQIDLEKAYNFTPVPSGINDEQKKQIIGLGAQMWGEWTPTATEIEYQTYPRIAAYAETGWTSISHKNYERFRNNINNLTKYWISKGYKFPSGEEY
ncbi:beta-N-acetylhexosaminidase [Sphingobacterium faecale]|uniref:beta-N-acetylhexosaminidase n=1 Tax=Sphingobacterium faecale TaxID=2803775 RepID=A0ABS1R4T6_9SPHI|nr:beta-N-acetylhexosaminidase [Sphingobacterium faecale]MBL1409239.1 beta-N-acetylhexosaminidase [Sphingobacterium faecale]